MQRHNITTIQIQLMSGALSEASKKRVTFFIHVYKLFLIFLDKTRFKRSVFPQTFITSVLFADDHITTYMYKSRAVAGKPREAV